MPKSAILASKWKYARGLLPAVLFCVLLLGQTSCGYHFANSLGCYKSINIPLAANDLHGFFTEAVAAQVKKRSALMLSNISSDLLLEMSLGPPRDEYVDYRYAHPIRGEPKNFVVPVGSRLEQSAEITLIRRSDGCRLLGLLKVTQTLTYDFESDFSRIDEHNFSLSELEMHELAYEEAFPRLQMLLAQKVVDLLSYCW